MKIIDTRDFQANDSWCRTALISFTALDAAEHKLRISIRYNAYDFQSYGRIDRWNGSEWKQLAEIPYPELAGVSREVSYSQRDTPRDSFDCDQSDLLDMAMAILA